MLNPLKIAITICLVLLAACGSPSGVVENNSAIPEFKSMGAFKGQLIDSKDSLKMELYKVENNLNIYCQYLKNGKIFLGQGRGVLNGNSFDLSIMFDNKLGRVEFNGTMSGSTITLNLLEGNNNRSAVLNFFGKTESQLTGKWVSTNDKDTSKLFVFSQNYNFISGKYKSRNISLDTLKGSVFVNDIYLANQSGYTLNAIFNQTSLTLDVLKDKQVIKSVELDKNYKDAEITLCDTTSVSFNVICFCIPGPFCLWEEPCLNGKRRKTPEEHQLDKHHIRVTVKSRPTGAMADIGHIDSKEFSWLERDPAPPFIMSFPRKYARNGEYTDSKGIVHPYYTQLNEFEIKVDYLTEGSDYYNSGTEKFTFSFDFCDPKAPTSSYWDYGKEGFDVLPPCFKKCVDDIPKINTSFFPISKDNSWNYKVTNDSTGENRQNTILIGVDTIITIVKKGTAESKDKSFTKSVTPEGRYYREDNDGIWVAYMPSYLYPDLWYEKLFIPNQTAVDEEWDEAGRHRKDLDRRTVVSNVSTKITVPAGTFDCYKFDVYRVESNKLLETFYCSKGIGLVKSVSGHWIIELVSYKVK